MVKEPEKIKRDISGNTGLSDNYEVICGPPDLIKLSEEICVSLFEKYHIEDLMDAVSKNRDKQVFVLASRDKPEKVSIIIDHGNKYMYSSGDPLFIPLPKKFAVLEPDKCYFEMTLRANVLLSVLEADEKELHR